MICASCGSSLTRHDGEFGYCPMCPGIRRAVRTRGEVVGRRRTLVEVLPERLLKVIRADREAAARQSAS